ncbi:P-loop NTPase fold protein [Curtobacterium sp. UNCCL17]|uniref:P-loop NTPase fold protein n=1 Tax=Curtobacterium sp. UNCCL17 TaxID=1449051 RepID=UPI0018CC33C6|nr:P-loop NTPase fold protein [Curtobacterium sp. UNCCL17]
MPSATIWNDDALDASDIPGRSDFALVLAERVNQVGPNQNSAVFGLVGAWGTGKSTLLAEVRSHLYDKAWTVVDFSPWASGDVTSITGEFIATLSGAFPGKKGKSLRRALAGYLRFGTPALSAIPIAGAAVAKIADAALTYAANQPAWHVAFKTISDEVARQNKRVLVIVDDVDRLDYEELKAVLRVVRLLGRFQNVHYLLAYDQMTIDKKLTAENTNGANSEFMEKIVQHPFEVPPVPMVTRRGWCRAIVDAHTVAVASDINEFEYAEQKEDLIRLLAEGIETPRSARRLGEQLDGLASLFADAEIDVLDFIALTWLRLNQHAVWDDVRTRPDRYLGWIDSDSGDLPDPRMEHLSHYVAREQIAAVSQVLRFLFVHSSAAENAGRKWRLYNERYFYRYFVVALTDADVSERLVDAALSELLSDEHETSELDRLKAIMVGANGERGALAIELAANARKDATTTTRSMMLFLWDLHAELSAVDGNSDYRISALNRWLAPEAELAIQSEVVTTPVFIDQFGYRQLVRAGYAARRRSGTTFEDVRAPYDNAISAWVKKLADHGVDAVSDADEVAVMTAFAHSFDEEKHYGFLGHSVHSADDLVRLADLFVNYNRWVGSGIHYEVAFYANEFRFAIGDALTRFSSADLPPFAGPLNYETDDREAPNLSPGERRDYAIRRVAEMLV